MGHIVSASRRTDIPRFFAEWFVRRIRAGYCLVPNPFDPTRASRVSLRATDVDVIVFWTKDPSPLMPRLGELDSLGHRYYFHYTLTAYSPDFEPLSRALSARIDGLRSLADLVGPDRVIWRYDPVIWGGGLGLDFHRHAVDSIVAGIAGSTTRAVVSLLDLYRHVSAGMRAVLPVGALAPDSVVECPDLSRFVTYLASLTSSHGMDLVSCAEGERLARLGIRPGKCIDAEYISRVFGIRVTASKDRSQRPECGCVDSRDIGVYDSCIGGCRYCYATRSPALAEARHREHDPDSPSLLPGVDEPSPSAQLELPTCSP